MGLCPLELMPMVRPIVSCHRDTSSDIFQYDEFKAVILAGLQKGSLNPASVANIQTGFNMFHILGKVLQACRQSLRDRRYW